MSAPSQANNINQEIERELARRLERAEAENKPAEVEIGGNLYLLVPVDRIQTTDDPATDYDPAKARAAVEAGAGAFKAMDVDTFIDDMLESREQDTPGHTF